MCPGDTCIHWGGRANSDCHHSPGSYLCRPSLQGKLLAVCDQVHWRLCKALEAPWLALGKDLEGHSSKLRACVFPTQAGTIPGFHWEAVYMQPMDRHFWWHPSDQAASFHLLMGKSLHLHDVSRLQSSGLSQRGVTIVYLMGWVLFLG